MKNIMDLKIFIAFLLIVAGCETSQNQVLLEASQENAMDVLKARIMGSYNYQEMGGFEIKLNSIGVLDEEDCQASIYRECYNIEYQYLVARGAKGVESIIIKAKVEGDDIYNYSYNEIREFQPACNLSQELVKKREELGRLREELRQAYQNEGLLRMNLGLQELVKEQIRLQEGESQERLWKVDNMIVEKRKEIDQLREETGIESLSTRYWQSRNEFRNRARNHCSVYDFASCSQAGHEILLPDCEGCRRQCITPEGRVFTESDDDV